MIRQATLAVVAGSGLDLLPLLDEVLEELSFRDVPGLEAAGVTGHAGRFVFGRSEGVQVILQCGRLHLYEGFDYEQATKPVVALHDFGAHSIIFTNAAGGLLPDMQPGELMATDALHLWPYAGWNLPSKIVAPDFVPEGC
jgi:purine-nucleoside phosphorylase